MGETRPPSVVIADDMRMMRVVLGRIVTALGYKVVGEAANGKEAVEQARKLKPDMLLLDINMPIMTGEEALRHIRRDSPDTMVIIATSLVDQDTVEHCLELGAANYIVKDSSEEEVREGIRDTWEGRE